MNITKLLAGLGVLSLGGGASIYSGISSSDIVVFNFDGSTSMRPIIEFLLDKYSKEQQQAVSFNVSAIGSNSGLQKLLQGTAEFALVSHDISHLPKEEAYKEKWEELGLKTVTLATESMVVLYKPPKKCTSDLILSEDNIKKVYSVFSGHRESGASETLRLKDLLENPQDSCDVPIYAWVKSTGPIKSGTAKSFVDIPLLKEACKTDCKEWYDKVKSSYGEDYPLNYVPESTPLHWSSFEHNLKDGAVTYLPSNFVLHNWDEITNLGIKFAKYKKKATQGSNETTFEWTKGIQDIGSVDWQRSFNIVFSVKDLDENQKKKEILEFIIKNAKDLTELHLSAKEYTIKNSSSGGTTSECTTQQGQQNPTEINLTCWDNTTATS